MPHAAERKAQGRLKIALLKLERMNFLSPNCYYIDINKKTWIKMSEANDLHGSDV